MHERAAGKLEKGPRLTLAGVPLYRELLEGVGDFRVSTADGQALAWRLEAAEAGLRPEAVGVSGELFPSPPPALLAQAHLPVASATQPGQAGHPSPDVRGREGEGSSAYSPRSTAFSALLLFPAVAGTVAIQALATAAETRALPEPLPEGRAYVRWFAADLELARRERFNVATASGIIKDKQPFRTGWADSMWFTEALPERPDQFVLHAEGWLWLPLAGGYRFALDADDAGMMLVQARTGPLVAFKGNAGMFVGRPVGMVAAPGLEPAACRLSGLLVEQHGAQGFIPYWRPSWLEEDVPIAPEYLLRYVPAEVAAYRPMAASAPHCYLAAVPLATSRLGFIPPTTQVGQAPPNVTIYHVSPVPPLEPRYAMYHLGQPLTGPAAPDGALTVRDLETGAVVAERTLPALPAPLREKQPPWALAAGLRTVLSSPAHFPNEFLTVDFRWDIHRRPPLRAEYMPLAAVIELAAGDERQVRRFGALESGGSVLDVPLTPDSNSQGLAAGDSPQVSCRLLLAGGELTREQVSVVPIEQLLADAGACAALRLKDGRLYTGEHEILVLLLRRLTAADKRAWRPVKALHAALRPASRLLLFSGTPVDAADALASTLAGVAVTVSAPAFETLGPLEMLRQTLAGGDAVAGSAVLLYPGGERAASMLSAFAYERVLAAALLALRQRGALRVLLVEEGVRSDLAASIADDWQVGFARLDDGSACAATAEAAAKRWRELADSLGPWW